MSADYINETDSNLYFIENGFKKYKRKDSQTREV